MTCWNPKCKVPRERWTPLCPDCLRGVGDSRVRRFIATRSSASGYTLAVSVAVDWFYPILGTRVWTKWNPNTGFLREV